MVLTQITLTHFDGFIFREPTPNTLDLNTVWLWPRIAKEQALWSTWDHTWVCTFQFRTTFITAIFWFGWLFIKKLTTFWLLKEIFTCLFVQEICFWRKSSRYLQKEIFLGLSGNLTELMQEICFFEGNLHGCQEIWLGLINSWYHLY